MVSASSLTPEGWADGALQVISESGLESLSVESLARRLGVTKGSFYWHFSSRGALLQVALSRWERRDANSLGKDLASIPSPRARLRRLLWRGGDRILDRLATSTDPVAVYSLKRARDRRLGHLAAVYGELGYEPDTAQRRALLAYAAFAGLGQLPPEDAERAIEMLIPSP